MNTSHRITDDAIAFWKSLIAKEVAGGFSEEMIQHSEQALAQTEMALLRLASNRENYIESMMLDFRIKRALSE